MTRQAARHGRAAAKSSKASEHAAAVCNRPCHLCITSLWLAVIEIFTPRCHALLTCGLWLLMWHISWSVYAGHTREPCKNGWTDQDAIWGGGRLVWAQVTVYLIGAHWRLLVDTIEWSVCLVMWPYVKLLWRLVLLRLTIIKVFIVNFCLSRMSLISWLWWKCS